MYTIMQSANIRQKLHQYVDKGDEMLLKLMYAVAREYNEEEEAFIAEMDRRTAEYESGKAKVLTLDQLEAGARKAYNKAKAKSKR